MSATTTTCPACDRKLALNGSTPALVLARHFHSIADEQHVSYSKNLRGKLDPLPEDRPQSKVSKVVFDQGDEILIPDLPEPIVRCDPPSNQVGRHSHVLDNLELQKLLKDNAQTWFRIRTYANDGASDAASRIRRKKGSYSRFEGFEATARRSKEESHKSHLWVRWVGKK